MAHTVRHTFVSPVADTGNPNEVGPDEWNAAHTVTLDADELLTSLKTVDGAGSGLDADLLDGMSSAAFAAASHTHTLSAITDAGTAAAKNTGTSGNTVALLDGANTWSSGQTFGAAVNVSGLTASYMVWTDASNNLVSVDPALQIQPPFVVGRWYPLVQAQTGAGGSAIVANQLRLNLFYLARQITISDLACRITTAASGGNLRLAIYNANQSTMAPLTVAAETGNISTTSTGSVSADITGSNVTLSAGWHWMAVIADSTAGGTCITLAPATAQVWLAKYVGSTTLGNVFNFGNNLNYAFPSTFGAFPDLTGQSLTESGQSICPAIAVKAA